MNSAASSSQSSPSSPSELFRQSLLAQWETVGTFSPLDIEHQIRYRLWNTALLSVDRPVDERLGVLEGMIGVVNQARDWEFQKYSLRWVKSPFSRHCIAAHQGEWLSVAVAGYACALRLGSNWSDSLLGMIQFELTSQAKVFVDLKKAKEGVSLMKAAHLISQNLRLLGQALDTWQIRQGDPLFDFVDHLGAETGPRVSEFGGAFSAAARLNRLYMAKENHRQFTLRANRSLRKSRNFLVPIAPFFDDWAESLVRDAQLSLSEVGELIQAMDQNWDKVTFAYPRAMAGLIRATPGGLPALTPYLAPEVLKDLQGGLLKSHSIPQSNFEAQWASYALN